jgi:ArsR family transcriptional regulator
MENIVSQCKALGDSNRFRIFMLLQVRPLCVCEILSVLDISGATLSAHLKVLEHSGLIGHRKDGRWVEYCVESKAASAWQALIRKQMGESSRIDMDKDKISRVTREICAKG